MKRDLYIDFAKGLATLSVIFIHTTYWSGQYYVPGEVRIFSLLFDVVLFYALSGITSSGNIEKTMYRLLKLQITYMIFVTILFFADYFFKVFGMQFFGNSWLMDFYNTFGEKYVPKSISMQPQWQNLGNWYLHQYSNADTFPVVMGSFWYLKVYFILALFGTLIVKFFSQHIPHIIVLCFVLCAIFNIFPYYYPSGQVGYVAFYLAIFLIGNQMRGKKIPTNWIVPLYVIVTSILIGLFWFYDKELFYQLNKQKFPPKWSYMLYLSFCLLTLFVGYNRLKIEKKSLVTYIGKNAIFYYFAQGITSSLIYFIVVPMKDTMSWYFLLPIVFLANLIMVIPLAEVLKKLDDLAWKILDYLKKITASHKI